MPLIVRVPLHVSGFWIPNYGSCTLLTGSVGAGILLNPLLEAEVLPTKKALINGREVPENLVNAVKRKVKVDAVGMRATSLAAGLGEGFGVSAAVSLSLAISALWRSGLGVDLVKASRIAHYAEVVNGTGLGDVIAEVMGRELVIRVKPGPPGIGEVVNVSIRDSVTAEAVKISELTTPLMLKRYADSIVKYGRSVMSEFLRKPSLEEFLRSSNTFSKLTGMLKPEVDLRIKEVLKELISSGCVLGYFVKKSLLMVISGSECSEEVIESLKVFGKVRLLTISNNSAEVLQA